MIEVVYPCDYHFEDPRDGEMTVGFEEFTLGAIIVDGKHAGIIAADNARGQLAIGVKEQFSVHWDPIGRQLTICRLGGAP